MAARRDRERRGPAAERRYSFAAPEQIVQPDETLHVDELDPTDKTPPPAANGESEKVTLKRSRALKPEAPAASTRGGVRPAALPFSAFKAEYAYVLGDLRRVALVIGSLLVILLLLNFILPR